MEFLSSSGEYCSCCFCWFAGAEGGGACFATGRRGICTGGNAFVSRGGRGGRDWLRGCGGGSGLSDMANVFVFLDGRGGTGGIEGSCLDLGRDSAFGDGGVGRAFEKRDLPLRL